MQDVGIESARLGSRTGGSQQQCAVGAAVLLGVLNCNQHTNRIRNLNNQRGTDKVKLGPPISEEIRTTDAVQTLASSGVGLVDGEQATAR